jgi:hypothetical protein
MSTVINFLLLTATDWTWLKKDVWKALAYIAIPVDGAHVIIRGPQIRNAETITDLPGNIIRITAMQRKGNTLTWWTDAELPPNDLAVINRLLTTGSVELTTVLTDKKKYVIGKVPMVEIQHATALRITTTTTVPGTKKTPRPTTSCCS